jgi:hypothetical protein
MAEQIGEDDVATEVAGDGPRVDDAVEGADEAQDGDLCDPAWVGESIDAALVLLFAIRCQTLEPFVLRPRGQLRALTLIAVVVVVVPVVPMVAVIVVPGVVPVVVAMWPGLTENAYQVRRGAHYAETVPPRPPEPPGACAT